MKLVIRDEKPKEEPEEIMEVWLKDRGGYISVMSKSSANRRDAVEVNIHPDRSITFIGGNFTRNK